MRQPVSDPAKAGLHTLIGITLDDFRERWYTYPSLFDRNHYQGWELAGGQTLAERAAQRVKSILKNHKVEPLPENVGRAIRGTVQQASGLS